MLPIASTRGVIGVICNDADVGEMIMEEAETDLEEGKKNVQCSRGFPEIDRNATLVPQNIIVQYTEFVGCHCDMIRVFFCVML
jgi:hypothetical protein